MSEHHEDDERRLAELAGHDRSNPSGIPDEGIDHEHEGRVHRIERRPVPLEELAEEHHEEGHEGPAVDLGGLGGA